MYVRRKSAWHPQRQQLKRKRTSQAVIVATHAADAAGGPAIRAHPTRLCLSVLLTLTTHPLTNYSNYGVYGRP